MTAAVDTKSTHHLETRDRLLLTALRLYAAHGLHAVSLRRISAEAGSKNSAAMHYHFHNKQGVLEALMAMIGRELGRIAKSLRSDQPRERSLRQACRATLQPLVLLRSSQPWGDDATRFLSRLASEESAEIATLVNSAYAPFWQRMDKALSRELPQLPAPVRRLRVMFITTNVVHGVAEAGWLGHSPLGDLSHFNQDTLVDHLVDFVIGGLVAPSHANA